MSTNVIYTDDKDISWLYDVAFERLVGQVDWVVCSAAGPMTWASVWTGWL